MMVVVVVVVVVVVDVVDYNYLFVVISFTSIN
jgi:hypothetical protein